MAARENSKGKRKERNVGGQKNSKEETVGDVLTLLIAPNFPAHFLLTHPDPTTTHASIGESIDSQAFSSVAGQSQAAPRDHIHIGKRLEWCLANKVACGGDRGHV